MFDEEVRFQTNHNFVYYVLTHWHTPPSWPPGASFKKVEPVFARRIILGAISDLYGNPNWALLHFLDIREHPRNLRSSDLEGLVDAHFWGIPRVVLYEELEEPRRGRLSDLKGRPASEYVPDHRLDFVEIEVIADDGDAITGAKFELYLPDGEGRIVVTDASGIVRLDRIPRGKCSLRLRDLAPQG